MLRRADEGGVTEEDDRVEYDIKDEQQDVAHDVDGQVFTAAHGLRDADGEEWDGEQDADEDRANRRDDREDDQLFVRLQDVPTRLDEFPTARQSFKHKETPRRIAILAQMIIHRSERSVTINKNFYDTKGWRDGGKRRAEWYRGRGGRGTPRPYEVPNGSVGTRRASSGVIVVCLVFLIGVFIPYSAAAQPQCGVVDGVSDPVDRAAFSIMQDFAVPNYRFRGMYHTAEDLAAGRGQTLGQPVRAIAAGRVTFSSPLAWGRDGGVVIIEHTFPDGSIYYSQYGHMDEVEGAAFPRPFTCVAQGDIIGVTGDARPSTHLHFEIPI